MDDDQTTAAAVAAAFRAAAQAALDDAAWHNPEGLADPNEISADDRAAARALCDLADRLHRHANSLSLDLRDERRTADTIANAFDAAVDDPEILTEIGLDAAAARAAAGAVRRWRDTYAPARPGLAKADRRERDNPAAEPDVTPGRQTPHQPRRNAERRADRLTSALREIADYADHRLAAAAERRALLHATAALDEAAEYADKRHTADLTAFADVVARAIREAALTATKPAADTEAKP